MIWFWKGFSFAAGFLGFWFFLLLLVIAAVLLIDILLTIFADEETKKFRF